MLLSKSLQKCKNFENLLRFDKVTESLKVGTFLRLSVVVGIYHMHNTTRCL